jgi:hypothetical protein
MLRKERLQPVTIYQRRSALKAKSLSLSLSAATVLEWSASLSTRCGSPETDSVIVTTSVNFDKYSKTSTVRPSVLLPPHSPPQSPPSHPRIGRFQPLLERLSIVEQPAPEGEDDDPALPQAGNSDDFDGFEEPHVNTPEPTRSNNVAPRREDINADFSERHIIHGPRTRRARVNFSSATFDYCFAMALVRLTTKPTRAAQLQTIPQSPASKRPSTCRGR